jgi:broad specificity phosphatase PhoE
MQLLLLTRHGQSRFNAQRLVNGDPARDRGLSERGLEEAGRLGSQLAAVEIDACVVSEFPRAQQTARAALGDERSGSTPWQVDADLNDIRVGELEGRTLQDYRAWKRGRGRDEPFPGGESLNDAALRYAAAYERMLERREDTILCVCHEIPVRYAINAAGRSDSLDRPIRDIANATLYLFDPEGLRRAVDRLRKLAG